MPAYRNPAGKRAQADPALASLENSRRKNRYERVEAPGEKATTPSVSRLQSSLVSVNLFPCLSAGGRPETESRRRRLPRDFRAARLDFDFCRAPFFHPAPARGNRRPNAEMRAARAFRRGRARARDVSSGKSARRAPMTGCSRTCFGWLLARRSRRFF